MHKRGWNFMVRRDMTSVSYIKNTARRTGAFYGSVTELQGKDNICYFSVDKINKIIYNNK